MVNTLLLPQIENRVMILVHFVVCHRGRTRCSRSLGPYSNADSEVLADLLTELERTIIHIFNAPPDVELVLDKTQAEAYVNSLARRVPELARLRGILSVLTASTMAVIERVLWNSGQGPLSTVARLEPSELRGLVAALYSKSPARDQLLRQLR
ncbi:ATP-dependent RNA helicase DDX55/SPB4 [Fasciola gigantica]|uniref:ATP-dependent RNA helicase DDX55/SPB4 n=1 Tax=Fasciola gigantica TaxID=46835 RepID=A0A504YV17_FASGI|nr:ATP-dependent RNA helicase DDX55/SPB4 [Fasciola gigantica]